MTGQRIAPKLVSWASQLEDGAREQAERSSRLPFVVDEVALMPDAHWGIGATVGSVIATQGAIVPAAVGVDIGCGMAAVHTEIWASDLPSNLNRLLDRIQQAVPAGVGKGHDGRKDAAGMPTPFLTFTDKQVKKAAHQFGSLGSGNHFVEVCLDEIDRVWVVLHSGSRGIGNELAQHHIGVAKGLMKSYFIELEDPELAYLVQGTDEFTAYLEDMAWAQTYAACNRDAMLDAVMMQFWDWLGAPRGSDHEIGRINCHHNYTSIEHQRGRDLYVTRKGAISARAGQFGIIPGSMGASTFIVRGLGNPASWMSCSHGAGRRLGRKQARRELTIDHLREQMMGRMWLEGHAEELLDESPDAYKDIDQVMRDQADLVEVMHTLRQIVNYKGVS